MKAQPGTFYMKLGNNFLLNTNTPYQKKGYLMTDQLSVDDKNKFLFSMLVMNYQAAALMHLGKIKEPTSQKEMKNLELAKVVIDTLEMLQHKTNNNLSKDETDLLVNTLNELRILYIKESDKSTAEKAEKSTN